MSRKFNLLNFKTRIRTSFIGNSLGILLLPLILACQPTVFSQDLSGQSFTFRSHKTQLSLNNQLSATSISLKTEKEPTGFIKVVEKQFKRKSKNGQCIIDIEYPQIENLPYKTVQAKVNSYLKDQFLQASGLALNIEKCISDQMIGWFTRFNAEFNRDGFLSINGFTSLTPGAHPTLIPKQFTFGLQNGKLYNFNDIFDPKSDYLEKINLILSKKIRKSIDNYVVSGQLSDKDASDLVSTFKPKTEYDFFIDKDGNIIITNVFDAYAYRAVTVSIEPSEVRELINSQGPLRSFQ
jgi:hypothetical protein